MEKPLSTSIVPILIFLLFTYILMYYASEYIVKSMILVTNIFTIILIIILAALGAYGILKENKQTVDGITSTWNSLSFLSKQYYDNDINTLLSTYQTRMLITAGLYFFLVLIGLFVILFAFIFYFKISNVWRPPLKSRISDERAQRYIELYAKYNENYKRLKEEEKGDIKKPEIQQEQVEEKLNLNADPKDKIEDEFNVENNNNNIILVNDQEVKEINNEEIMATPKEDTNKKTRKGLPSLRRKKEA